MKRGAPFGVSRDRLFHGNGSFLEVAVHIVTGAARRNIHRLVRQPLWQYYSFLKTAANSICGMRVPLLS